MSNMKRLWEDYIEDEERKLRSAGLTNDTIEKMTKYLLEKSKEESDE